MRLAANQVVYPALFESLGQSGEGVQDEILFKEEPKGNAPRVL